MALMNKSIIGDYQARSLKEKIDANIRDIDLNFQGTTRLDARKNLVKEGTSANVNRVLFWLASKHNDYIREDFKGGILYDLLGQLNNTTNLKQWEDAIISKFNYEFSGDLDLLLLKLTTDSSYRKLYINMTVRDKLKGITFPVSTEASI